MAIGVGNDRQFRTFCMELGEEKLATDPRFNTNSNRLENSTALEKAINLVASPIKLSKTPVSYDRHPPLVGEHTEEILLEHKYPMEKVQEWRKNGIL